MYRAYIINRENDEIVLKIDNLISLKIEMSIYPDLQSELIIKELGLLDKTIIRSFDFEKYTYKIINVEETNKEL